MSIFGGSPIAVDVPPILAKMTSAVMMGSGSRSVTLHKLIVTGTKRRIVVTLSMNAETNVTKQHRITSNLSNLIANGSIPQHAHKGESVLCTASNRLWQFCRPSQLHTQRTQCLSRDLR